MDNLTTHPATTQAGSEIDVRGLAAIADMSTVMQMRSTEVRILLGRLAAAEEKVAAVTALVSGLCDARLCVEQIRNIVAPAVDKQSTAVRRVHNHPPYRPVCNERRLPDGQLRGACLTDDGGDR